MKHLVIAYVLVALAYFAIEHRNLWIAAPLLIAGVIETFVGWIIEWRSTPCR